MMPLVRCSGSDRVLQGAAFRAAAQPLSRASSSYHAYRDLLMQGNDQDGNISAIFASPDCFYNRETQSITRQHRSDRYGGHPNNRRAKPGMGRRRQCLRLPGVIRLSARTPQDAPAMPSPTRGCHRARSEANALLNRRSARMLARPAMTARAWFSDRRLPGDDHETATFRRAHVDQRRVVHRV